MNKLGVLWQLALADISERTRRYSFLVTMLGVLFFGYLVITGKYTVQFGDCRTVYDAVWAGHLMAVCGSIMLTLVGFYLVKGSIKRDRRTQVGQIIAASRISNSSYIIAKFAGNVMVLWIMAVVLAVLAFITLVIRNEAATINLWAFISPFLAITMPTTIFVAAMAVLFDTIRWLRGSIGNVIYLFLAEACIILGILDIQLLDLGAVSVFTESVRAAARVAFPGEKIALIMGFVAFDPMMQVENYKIFTWNGIDWTPQLIFYRLLWVGLAIASVLLAVPFFDRFDPAKVKRRTNRNVSTRSTKQMTDRDPELILDRSYGDLPTARPRFSVTRLLMAELRLALKGYHWIWYAIAGGLAAAQIFAPFDITRLYLVPAAMIWPLIIWSSIGTRDHRHNTSQLLCSSAQPLTRQFPARWASGLVIALAAVCCMLVRAVAVGEYLYVMALLMGAVFVPTAALTLGTLSRSNKLFEVSYLLVWYIGSIEHLAAIDLLGTTAEAVTSGKLMTLGILMVISLLVAFTTRGIQLARDQ